MTMTVVMSNIKVQPMSVRAPIDIRDSDIRYGKMCAQRDAGRRLGRKRILL